MYGARYDDSAQLHHPSAQSRMQAHAAPQDPRRRAPGCPTVSTHACHSAVTAAQSHKLLSRLLSRLATSSRLKGLYSVSRHTPGGPGADRWAATEPASKPLHGMSNTSCKRGF